MKYAKEINRVYRSPTKIYTPNYLELQDGLRRNQP